MIKSIEQHTNRELAEYIRFTPLRGNHEPIEMQLSRKSLEQLACLSIETGKTVHQIMEESLRLYRSFPDCTYKFCQQGCRNISFKEDLEIFLEGRI